MLTRILALVAVLLLAPSTLAHANARALSLESASLGIFAGNVDLLQEIPDLTHCCIKEKSTERSESSNHREEYLRARYMDPSQGRFASLDRFDGCLYCVKTLNKYNYGIGNPVMEVDPSGLITMTELTTAMNEIGALRASAVQAFRSGSSRVGGQLMRQMGKRAQDLIGQIIRDCLKINPREVRVPGGRRTIDYLVQLADKLEFVEVKSGLPARIAGPAMRRLAEQLRAAYGAGMRPKVVFTVAFDPERLGQLIRFFSRNGVDVSPADIIVGGVDFAQWLGEAFVEVCIEPG